MHLKISALQNLTYNLEPVYGILLAFIFFKENYNWINGFTWCCFNIIGCVVTNVPCGCA